MSVSKHRLYSMRKIFFAVVFFVAIHSPKSTLAEPARKETKPNRSSQQSCSSDHKPNPETLKKIQEGALNVERAKKQVSHTILQAVEQRIFWEAQTAANTAVTQAQSRLPPNPSTDDLIRSALLQDKLTHRNHAAVMRKYRKYNLILSELAAIIQIGLSKHWRSPKQ